MKSPLSMPADSRVLLPSLTIPLRLELILLTAVVCIAAFFRLYQLGEPAFRADTMIFLDFARQSIGFGDVFAKWTTSLGMQKTGQFPFAVAWMKLFLDITGAPITPFMVRLPSALWGILAVLAIYGCGRVLAGNAFALFLAALFALNPFHIGISREAYFYPPLVCGGVLLLWAVLLQVRAVKRHNAPLFSYVGPALAHGRLREGTEKTGAPQAAAPQNLPLIKGLQLPVGFYVLLAAGFFLTTYAQPSSWSFAFLAASIIIWFQIRSGLREPTPSATGGLRRLNRRIPRSLLWIALILALIGIPLLFADWALPQMISISTSAHKAYIDRIFGTDREPMFFLLVRTLFSFGWGMTLPRILFSVAVLLLSAAATIRFWRRSAVMPVLCILLGGGVALYVAARCLLMAAVSSRYLLAFLPAYLIWLVCGLWFAYPMLAGLRGFGKKTAPAVSSGLMVVALGLNIWPAWLATQLTGKPIPYWDIVRWCDKNLPPRTLVLVERWLDPWNELRVHNSTNVYFTFPVPSEPPDVFKQVNWPLAARQFMEKFPDAAYLEFCHSERAAKGVVTGWPFARNVAFTNEAALRLAKLRLAHREEFFDPHTNRLMVTIFYNSRADVVAQARQAGKQYLTLYGPEWGYVKLWQQLQDFRDWRILEKQASLDIYNLTASTNRVTLKIQGMALNGLKRVSAESVPPAGAGQSVRGGEYHDFRHLQLDAWTLKDVFLKPGLNKAVFSDSLWSVSKIPLLVDQVEVIPSPP